MSGPFYQPGDYVCRVTQQGFGESKNNNPMILIGIEPQSRLVRGPDGSEENEACDQNYERTVRLVIGNDEQKEYALLKLRYAGFQGDSFSKMSLVDCDVRCTCKHQNGTGEHSDKIYEQWDLMLPPRERTPLQPLDGQATRKLDAMFGRRLKEGAKAAQPEAVAAAQGEDDRIPF